MQDNPSIRREQLRLKMKRCQATLQQKQTVFTMKEDWLRHGALLQRRCCTATAALRNCKEVKRIKGCGHAGSSASAEDCNRCDCAKPDEAVQSLDDLLDAVKFCSSLKQTVLAHEKSAGGERLTANVPLDTQTVAALFQQTKMSILKDLDAADLRIYQLHKSIISSLNNCSAHTPWMFDYFFLNLKNVGNGVNDKLADCSNTVGCYDGPMGAPADGPHNSGTQVCASHILSGCTRAASDSLTNMIRSLIAFEDMLDQKQVRLCVEPSQCQTERQDYIKTVGGRSVKTLGHLLPLVIALHDQYSDLALENAITGVTGARTVAVYFPSLEPTNARMLLEYCELKRLTRLHYASSTERAVCSGAYTITKARKNEDGEALLMAIDALSRELDSTSRHVQSLSARTTTLMKTLAEGVQRIEQERLSNVQSLTKEQVRRAKNSNIQAVLQEHRYNRNLNHSQESLEHELSKRESDRVNSQEKVYNSARVKQRRVADAKSKQDKQRRLREQLQRELALLDRIKNFTKQFPNIVPCYERLIQATEASTVREKQISQEAEDSGIFRDPHSFTNSQLMNDSRHKLQTILYEYGLHSCPAARDTVSALASVPQPSYEARLLHSNIFS